MRPLTLELEGFTAFRQKTCLDLSNLDLFAITGPTGAGKSSLIDAIAYALYGRVPRVANQIGACLSQGLQRMYVQLEFQAGHERYRVFREFRDNGRGNVRLERARNGDWWDPLAGRVNEVNERIERIIGLDFDGFSRSVVLPQGQFQEFLAGSPDKRREVLRGLLRLDVYERVRARAAARAAELNQKVAGIDRRLQEDYGEATPENLTLVRQQLDTAAAEANRLVQELSALQGALDRARDLARARGEAEEARVTMAAAEKTLVGAQQLVREGGSKIQEKRRGLGEIGDKIAATEFDPTCYAALSRAEPIAESLEKLRAQMHTADDELRAADSAAGAARASSARAGHDAEEAQRRRQLADERLQHAQRHNAAAAAQEGLVAGDLCPVCGAMVGELPAIECPDLEQARSAAEKARAAERAAQQGSARAGADVARAEAQAEAARRSLDQLAERRQAGEAQLAEALPGDGDHSLSHIRAALARQRHAQRDVEQAKREEFECRAELERLDRQFEQAREGLARLQAEADAASKALAAAEASTRTALGQLIEMARPRNWTDVTQAAPAGDAASLIQERLTGAQRRGAELQDQMGRLKQSIDQIEGQISTRKALEEELEALRRAHGVAADLAQMLGANRFQAFVQSEALRLLAEEGSRRLEELSAGRYRLAVAANGQDFEVVDQWNDYEARPVRTLSGGETFLASLALAVALAETLPGLAASREMALDSIFLDEGFGSLDPEALDRAADALDALRARNRMVCVVTHLKELAERLPSRVIVHKSETGSTLEVA